MRFAIILLLCVSCASAPAQSALWDHVSPSPERNEMTSATISDAQQKAIGRLLKQSGPSAVWECEKDEIDGLVANARVETIRVSPTQTVLLVEAPAGCARGGQGANGAMWLFRFQGETPVLLASPKNGFNGWLYSIQSSSSHGYRDIVLGWHMSAREAALSYFQFDGRIYRNAGSASMLFDEDGNGKIVATSR